MTKRFPNLECGTGYDGYDDYDVRDSDPCINYLDAVIFDYTDDLFESDRDYDREIKIPDYMRV